MDGAWAGGTEWVNRCRDDGNVMGHQKLWLMGNGRGSHGSGGGSDDDTDNGGSRNSGNGVSGGDGCSDGGNDICIINVLYMYLSS